MTIAKIFRRSLQITWRWKDLWILGLPYGIYQGLSRIFSILNNQILDSGLDEVGTYFVLTCAASVLSLSLLVFLIITTGGLIEGVKRIERKRSFSLKNAWTTGVRIFWPLIGFGLLWIVLVLILVVVASLLYGVVSLVLTGDLVQIRWLSFAFNISIYLLNSILFYGAYSVILENRRGFDALKRSWRVLFDNFTVSLTLMLIFYFFSYALNSIISYMLEGLINLTGSPFWTVGSGKVVIGSIIIVVLLTGIYAISWVITSSTWTLAYISFVKRK